MATDHGDGVVVELEPHLAADEFLAAVDGGLEDFRAPARTRIRSRLAPHT